MDMSYYEIGYFTNDAKTARKYVESIYKQSISYDSDEQDALRIPEKELAEKMAKWLKKRDGKTDYDWFVVEKVTTENIDTV